MTIHVQVKQEQLRWAVGCIVAEDDSETNDQLVAKLLENGYKKFSTPRVSDAVCTTFPNTTWLSMYIAIARVYPALDKFVTVSSQNIYNIVKKLHFVHILYA